MRDCMPVLMMKFAPLPPPPPALCSGGGGRRLHIGEQIDLKKYSLDYDCVVLSERKIAEIKAGSLS